MTNFEKAIDTIVHQNAQRRDRRGDVVDVVTVQAATEYVQALKDAGLLMPDLPDPKRLTDNAYYWRDTHTYLYNAYRDGVSIEKDTLGSVTAITYANHDAEIIVDIDHGEQILSPEHAERLGLALLAAAQKLKGQQ